MSTRSELERDVPLDRQSGAFPLPITSGLGNYERRVELPFELPTGIYAGMLVIWLLRPVLQRRFPLHLGNRCDYLRFLAWCLYVGRRDYKLLRDLEMWNRELMSPTTAPCPKNDGWNNSLTVAQTLIAVARSGYRLDVTACTRSVRDDAARWYWRLGRDRLHLAEIPGWQLDRLRERFVSPYSMLRYCANRRSRPGVDNYRQLLRRRRDLLYAWSEAAPAKPPQAQVTTVGATSLFQNMAAWLSDDCGARRLFRRRWRAEQRPSHESLVKVICQVPTGRETHLEVAPAVEFGVNLFGYAHGELGIGEDVRMLAFALHEAKVPFCIVNVKPGEGVSQSDLSVQQWVTGQPRFPINIFCMTGVEQTRYLVEQGAELLDGRYNIGYWPWELPEWPEVWHHAWNSVQEIWGISSYAAAAYRAAPVPVHTMGLPVKLGEVADVSRADLGLPDQAYLFIYSFDLNSTLARKNPEGAVIAFQRAFPYEPGSRVGLVLKVNHPSEKNPKWQSLRRRIAEDERIHLIEGSMRRQQVLGLYKVCNCFLSLHRAEGFGRAIAEAQLLGMEVIATAYSGNMDYCSDQTCSLVGYRRRRLYPNEYAFSDGQIWAEPDLEDASLKMRQSYNRKNRAGTVSHATERFGLGYCGERFAERLRHIDTWMKCR